ncbi:MAG: hypothetical protein DI535_06675 [Citrobacter freundii]|nr:MAG: hypothetical protein DI535_06675 [Citrobacter freundii]
MPVTAQKTLIKKMILNTIKKYLFVVLRISKRQLFLSRFFIGYWILKTGLHFHADPFFCQEVKEGKRSDKPS